MFVNLIKIKACMNILQIHIYNSIQCIKIGRSLGQSYAEDNFVRGNPILWTRDLCQIQYNFIHKLLNLVIKVVGLYKQASIVTY
jgi:hypothetical protein